MVEQKIRNIITAKIGITTPSESLIPSLVGTTRVLFNSHFSPLHLHTTTLVGTTITCSSQRERLTDSCNSRLTQHALPTQQQTIAGTTLLFLAFLRALLLPLIHILQWSPRHPHRGRLWPMLGHRIIRKWYKGKPPTGMVGEMDGVNRGRMDEIYHLFMLVLTVFLYVCECRVYVGILPHPFPVWLTNP